MLMHDHISIAYNFSNLLLTTETAAKSRYSGFNSLKVYATLKQSNIPDPEKNLTYSAIKPQFYRPLQCNLIKAT